MTMLSYTRLADDYGLYDWMGTDTLAAQAGGRGEGGGQPPIVSKPKCVIKSISYQRVFQNTHVPMHVLEILCFVSFDSAVRERNFSRSQARSSLHEWVTDLH